MKIAIIVHSLSGNTRKFADSLFEKLISDGHTVNLTQLETTVPIKSGTVRQQMDIHFTNLPDITDAEILLFGGPVWAFGPSPIIVEAIRQLGNLKGKRALSFITQGFPFKGMGGKGALKWMNTRAATQGAKIIPGSICCQMFHDLPAQIAKETISISDLLKAT